VRHFEPVLETMTHGFLNLFISGVLARSHDLSEETLLAIIEEEEPTAFTFSEDGLEWRQIRADAQDVESARRIAVTSFGSCSFSEPLDHLRELGLLTPDGAGAEQNTDRGGQSV
jgi:hypothetical protein